MNSANDIRFIPRAALDIRRWDDCIRQSGNCLIYGYHYYLDHMTDGQWNALVLGDYKSVMPLTWRQKWGVLYCCQPAFTQQTGIFSPEPVLPDQVDGFLEVLMRYYPFAEIYPNYGNAHPSFQPRENLVLPLNEPYLLLEARYKKDLTRNLRSAARAGFVYSKDIGLDTALEAYRRQYARRHPAIRASDYRRFKSLCLFLREKGQLILRAALAPNQDPAANADNPLATALLFRDGSRLYLIQSTTPPAGRKTEANHFLLDQLIREWAGSGLTLDFEGSDLPGIAYFYANFGAVRQPYFYHRHNRLAWPLKLLKP